MFNRLRNLLHVVVVFAVTSAVGQSAIAQKTPEVADAPYKNILVIFLASSFDSRRYLETEIVKALEDKGTRAVRSTSLMDSRVPMKRETFIAQVEEIGADAVLVSQLANLEVRGKVVDMSPQATYNVWPTYWYNVWSVELTEYVEPQGVNYEGNLSLATQLFSVQTRDVVWTMESNSNLKRAFDRGPDYSIYVDEAKDIVKELRKARMIER